MKHRGRLSRGDREILIKILTEVLSHNPGAVGDAFGFDDVDRSDRMVDRLYEIMDKLEEEPLDTTGKPIRT